MRVSRVFVIAEGPVINKCSRLECLDLSVSIWMSRPKCLREPQKTTKFQMKEQIQRDLATSTAVLVQWPDKSATHFNSFVNPVFNLFCQALVWLESFKSNKTFRIFQLFQTFATSCRFNCEGSAKTQPRLFESLDSKLWSLNFFNDQAKSTLWIYTDFMLAVIDFAEYHPNGYTKCAC